MLQVDVEALATRAGRMVGTRGHDAARTYLLGRMEQLGLEGYDAGSFEVPYAMDGARFTNLIGRLRGSRPDLDPVLLAAHYDTCGPLPGADDNAAAIAILLALVERLRERKLERQVLFAFFDAEEPPHFLQESMGSIVYYRRQRKETIHCAVVLDLVGHDVPLPGLADLLFITGMESDAELAGVVKACAGIEGLRTIPTLNDYAGDLSDHHAFRLDRRPYLFLSCAQWEHYHMPTDTPDRLNYAKMQAVADYLAALTPRLCASRLAGPFEGYDSTETELYFLRKHLKPFAAALSLRLESRADIDALADALLKRLIC